MESVRWRRRLGFLLSTFQLYAVLSWLWTRPDTGSHFLSSLWEFELALLHVIRRCLTSTATISIKWETIRNCLCERSMESLNVWQGTPINDATYFRAENDPLPRCTSVTYRYVTYRHKSWNPSRFDRDVIYGHPLTQQAVKEGNIILIFLHHYW